MIFHGIFWGGFLGNLGGEKFRLEGEKIRIGNYMEFLGGVNGILLGFLGFLGNF